MSDIIKLDDDTKAKATIQEIKGSIDDLIDYFLNNSRAKGERAAYVAQLSIIALNLTMSRLYAALKTIDEDKYKEFKARNDDILIEDINRISGEMKKIICEQES